MRVLVTGGHGFVGSHLVDRLLAEGDEVRCLYRRPGEPRSLAGRGVEIVKGDARDPAAARRAVRGVDEVHHLAALTRSRTRREMLDTNLGATRTLLEAAAGEGISGRFVLCSSLAAVGPSPPGRALVETDPCRPVTWYGESKRLAEEAARVLARDVPVTTLRPPAVYGPRDTDFLGVFRAARRGILPRLGDGPRTYSFVYAADLAAAFVLAARRPATVGGTFFVSHPEIVAVEEFLARVAHGVGRRGRLLHVPNATLALAAELSEVLAQITGRVPLLNRQRLKELQGAAYVCSAASFVRATGWRAETDTDQGCLRTASWYCEHGLLAPSRGSDR